MFLLVSKFKMIGVLLNVVHALKNAKNANKHITNKSYTLHDHATLLTMHTFSRYFPFFFFLSGVRVSNTPKYPGNECLQESN